MNKTIAFLIFTLCPVFIFPNGAWATALPIVDSGSLAISNIGGSLVGLTTIPFCINWSGGSTCGAGTTHGMAVSGISNDFAIGISAIDAIKDVTGIPGPVITDFEMVQGAGALAGQTVNFNLTSISLANGGIGLGNCGSNAPDNTCAEANSPFKLSEDDFASQVTVTFSVSLDAYTGASASGTTAYRGIFSTTYSGTLSGSGACSGLSANITNIVSCEAAGGTIDSTWSASEAPVAAGSTVPEPANLWLMGIGIFGGVAGWRRLRTLMFR
jgi:hypothetical protein